MGYYVNPKNETKEKYLDRVGIRIAVNKVASAMASPEAYGQLPVCLVDTGAFTAAAIAFSKKELEVFMEPDDRPKKFYLVSVTNLLIASDLKLDVIAW